MTSAAEKALLRDAAARARIAKDPHRGRAGRRIQCVGSGRVRPADAPISPAELEVLKLMGDGLTNEEIAAHLIKGVETVKSQVRRIIAYFKARNRTHAVALAIRAGIIA